MTHLRKNLSDLDQFFQPNPISHFLHKFLIKISKREESKLVQKCSQSRNISRHVDDKQGEEDNIKLRRENCIPILKRVENWAENYTNSDHIFGPSYTKSYPYWHLVYIFISRVIKYHFILRVRENRKCGQNGMWCNNCSPENLLWIVIAELWS